MPTIIDSLMVQIGVDSSGFKKGSSEAQNEFKKTKESVVKHGKDIEKAGKDAAEFFNKLKVEAMGLIAVFTGGRALKDFTVDTIQSTAGLARLGQNINMSAKELLQWQMANKQAGGTAEGMTQALIKSANDFAKIGRGEAFTGQDDFFRYGGNISGVKSGIDLLKKQTDVVSAIYKSGRTELALNVANNMGLGEVFNLIKTGKVETMDLVAAMEKNAKVTQENEDATIRLDRAMKSFGDTTMNMGRGILFQFLPEMEIGLKNLSKIIEDNKPNIVVWLDSSLVKINEFVVACNKAAESVGGWHNVLMALIAIKFPVASAGLMGYLGGSWLNEKINEGMKIATGGKNDTLGGWIADKTEGLGKKIDDFGTWLTGIEPTAPTNQPTIEQKTSRTMPTSTSSIGDKKARLAMLEKQYGLPEGVLDSLWMQESSRGKNTLSPKGAEGDFQFMPKTAQQYGLKNPYDFNESSEAAARMMKDLMAANSGNLTRALSAYNWGQGNLNKYGIESAPPETRNFSREIEGRMGNTQTSTTDIQVNGPITINTQATNGRDVANAFKDHFGKNMVTQQVNSAY